MYAKVVPPPYPQKLSRILQVLSTRNDPQTLNSLTIRNLSRVNRLVRSADSCSIKELLILREWLLNDRNKHSSIIGVEYDFDDGARIQGRGDALLLRKDEIIVVECKRIMPCTTEECKAKRRAHVARQALGYACRLTSWLRHIELVENGNQVLPFKTVLAATLIGSCINQPTELSIIGSFNMHQE